PALVTALLLVDGGLPLDAPPGVGVDEAVQAVLGPAAERLAMTFPSRAAYRKFWQQHPAFVDDWSPAVADYVDYDLFGDEPRLRPSTSFDALAADSRDITLGTALPKALERLRHPARLLLAERGMLDQLPPLYPDDALAPWRGKQPRLRIDRVDGVNHYTITMHERGITHVAEAVRALLP
ncbi:MAG: alpha/beta hydrolase, partial [Jiangellaceae bacterium]